MTEKIDRILGVSCVTQVQRRNKHALEVASRLKTRNFIENLLKESDFFKDAPFEWINFIFLEGTENTFKKPRIGRVSKKYHDLPVTAELASEWLEYAEFNDEAMLDNINEASLLESLIYVGRKYNLPIEALEKRLEEIGGFPELPEDFYEKLPPSAWRAPKGQLPLYKKIIC